MNFSPSDLGDSAPARTYAVGDIHGCTHALDTLLEFLPLRPQDTLIFLGDYVDRGPDSMQVLVSLIELRDSRPNTVFLRGNHDLWMVKARDELEWFRSWLSRGVGGRQTLESYGGAAHIPAEHFAFLEIDCRDFYETDTEIFVHGALEHDLDLEFQVEEWLLWARVTDMQPHFSGKRVICGHTSQKNGLPLDLEFAVCVDTWCHGDGWLSALCTQTGEVFQSNKNRQTRKISLDS